MRLPWNKERADLDREMAYHLDALAESFEAQGYGRAEAVAKARREFGGLERVKEECRDESRWSWLIQLQQDLRFGWRMMKRSPTVTLAAVASLAVGIGATTAIYSFADAVLWRKIAVPAPEQIVEIFWQAEQHSDDLIRGSSGSAFREGHLTIADYFSTPAVETMREQTRGMLEIAAHIPPQEVSVLHAGDVSVARVRGVSENFFSTLRVHPAAGSLFNGDKAPQVVVSHSYWEKRLQSSANTVGDIIRLNNVSYTIVGILPAPFFGIAPGDEAELYTTITQSPGFLEPNSWYKATWGDPYAWSIQLVARRAPGVSMEQARAKLDAVFASTWAARPKKAEATPRIRLMDASTGLGGLRRQLGDPAWILLGLAATVLLVACANIANLLLARSAERAKEVGVRVSLGCGSGRLMRQFLTESLMMAAVGGAFSVLVALSMGSLMTNVLPAGLNAEQLMIDFDSRTLAITAAVTVATALLFGLFPAWRASRADAFPVLKEGSGTAGSVARNRLAPARLLVLAQVALGVLLVTAAIVYTGNLSAILNKDAGFERAHALLFDLRPGELGYSEQQLDTFHRNVQDRLRAIPGVLDVGLSRNRPMRGGGYFDRVNPVGGIESIQSSIHQVTSGFLGALGVPLLTGRGFTVQEIANDSRVAIVSEQLVKDLKLANPLGTRIKTEGNEYEIIGVARNASYSRLTQQTPVTYLPLPKGTRTVTVLLRTSINPAAVIGAAREAIRSLDGGVPLVDVFTMEQQISRTLQRERMFAWLCGSFGVLALVLCVVGIYGLMSYTTARRIPEIGIRMALGASARRVMRQVIGDGMRLALLGMIAGVPVAIYAAKLAQSLQLLPAGPLPYWTLGAALAVLIVSTFIAVLGPALRASTVDPMKALRQG